jgi:hypothetical protein
MAKTIEHGIWTIHHRYAIQLEHIVMKLRTKSRELIELTPGFLEIFRDSWPSVGWPVVA